MCFQNIRDSCHHGNARGESKSYNKPMVENKQDYENVNNSKLQIWYGNMSKSWHEKCNILHVGNWEYDQMCRVILDIEILFFFLRCQIISNSSFRWFQSAAQPAVAGQHPEVAVRRFPALRAGRHAWRTLSHRSKFTVLLGSKFTVLLGSKFTLRVRGSVPSRVADLAW